MAHPAPVAPRRAGALYGLQRERSFTTQLTEANARVVRANGELAAANRQLRDANKAARAAEALADARLDRAMAAIEDDARGFNVEAIAGGRLPADLRDRLLDRPRAF